MCSFAWLRWIWFALFLGQFAEDGMHRAVWFSLEARLTAARSSARPYFGGCLARA